MYFFFLTFVLFILVFFWTLKTCCSLAFCYRFIVVHSIFCFCLLLFYSETRPRMSLLHSCVASVFKHYIPRCSYTYPECISFVVFFPSPSPSPHCQMYTLFVCFFLPEFSGWPLHIHLSCPLLTLCPVIQSKEKVPFFVQFWWLSFSPDMLHVPVF